MVASLLSFFGRSHRPAASLDSRRLEVALGLLGRRVLVVDDNPSNQALARAVLEAAGVEVVAAADGAEALETLAAQNFDVVLMDMRMPRMSGPQALARIRAGAAGRTDIPVIALTADPGDRDLASFDGRLGKPTRPGDLLAAVEHALQPGEQRVDRLGLYL